MRIKITYITTNSRCYKLQFATSCTHYNYLKQMIDRHTNHGFSYDQGKILKLDSNICEVVFP